MMTFIEYLKPMKKRKKGPDSINRNIFEFLCLTSILSRALLSKLDCSAMVFYSTNLRQISMVSCSSNGSLRTFDSAYSSLVYLFRPSRLKPSMFWKTLSLRWLISASLLAGVSSMWNLPSTILI